MARGDPAAGCGQREAAHPRRRAEPPSSPARLPRASDAAVATRRLRLSAGVQAGRRRRDAAQRRRPARDPRRQQRPSDRQARRTRSADGRRGAGLGGAPASAAGPRRPAGTGARDQTRARGGRPARRAAGRGYSGDRRRPSRRSTGPANWSPGAINKLVAMRDPDCLFCKIVAGELPSQPPSTPTSGRSRSWTSARRPVATRWWCRATTPRTFSRSTRRSSRRWRSRRSGSRSERSSGSAPTASTSSLVRSGRVADGLSPAHARDPAVRGRSAEAPVGPVAGRPGRDRGRGRAARVTAGLTLSTGSVANHRGVPARTLGTSAGPAGPVSRITAIGEEFSHANRYGQMVQRRQGLRVHHPGTTVAATCSCTRGIAATAIAHWPKGPRSPTRRRAATRAPRPSTSPSCRTAATLLNGGSQRRAVVRVQSSDAQTLHAEQYVLNE